MNQSKPDLARVGIVGLGLTGRGIATCLLAKGFPVKAYNRSARHASGAVVHIGQALEELVRRKVCARGAIRNWRAHFALVRSPEELGDCPFVIESVKEDLPLKREIFRKLEIGRAHV